MKCFNLEKTTKWIRQLGVKSTSITIEKISEHKVDGSILCCLKSSEDLVTKYGVPSEDAKIIFGSVESLKNYNINNKEKTHKRNCYYSEDNSTDSKSGVIDAYEKIPPDFYETLEESLKTAEFKNVNLMMKLSKEIAKYLNKNGTLEKYGMTMADAMAITLYTYDNGADEFESNPYRIINKVLSERNIISAQKLRGYILRLLSALRKLPSYGETKKLYRAVTNINKDNYKVGSIRSWPAFTSTSTDEKSIIDFFGNIAVKGDKCIFEITGWFGNGHSIKEFSFHPDEDGKQLFSFFIIYYIRRYVFVYFSILSTYSSLLFRSSL